MEVRFL